MLQATTAQNKIAKLKKRVRIVQGGTSSSKTFTILPLLIQYAIQTPNSEISVVAESIPHLKRGAMKDFIKIMKWSGNFKEDNFNRSNLTYKFTNGSFIEFFSADQPDKLRGARRDVLFINECNNVSFESYQQLAIRTKKFIYLDFNPTNEFWVHKELKDDSNSEFIILTYKDNEALDPAIVKEIEKAREKAKKSAYWQNWWNVYGLGQLGCLQGVIFDNWVQVFDIPKDAKLLGYGMDFGFTNDPTTLVAVYKMDGELFFDELLYKTNMTNNEVGNFMKSIGVTRNYEIVADSAEPKSIAELKNQGFNITGAKKGNDSIKVGIDVLKRFKLNVTQQSTNLIKELRGYQWEKDRDGKETGKPVKNFNHAIDALRYYALNNLGQLPKTSFKGKTYG